MNDNQNPSDDEVEEVEDWRDEHGQPSFTFLESLVEDGSPEALEKLRSIADDLDVEYESGNTPQELVEKIREAVRNDPEMTA